MTDSKAPRFAWGTALALMVAAGFTLAACSGGDDGLSQAQEEALQQELEDAEEALRQAELEEARAAEREAAAERERQAEAQRRQQAEAEREAAEEERDELQDQITQIDARFALDGFRPMLRREVGGSPLARIGRAHTGAASMVAVTPRHGMTALIEPTPSWGFSTDQRSSSSGWTVTRHMNSGHDHDDELVVYDDRGGPVSVSLVQEFRGGSRFQDGDSANAGTEIMGGITTADDAEHIRSGAFPSTDGTDTTFAFNHDPDHTMAGGDANMDGNYANDYDRYRVSGSFMNAGGHFECTSAPCTIGRRGDRFVVTGTWVFKTTDRAIARIDDRSYAYFGWWRRDLRENETYSYLPFADIAPDATSGGGATLQYSATSDATNFDALTASDSATYRGPAIGQYAIYQPLNGQSGTGEFTAQTELTANFGNNMLSGRVTNFSNDPDWSLTLNLASMAGGNVEDSDDGWVNWTIDGQGTSDVRGKWYAEFYSESDFVGQVPDGVVGTFTALFDSDINDMEDFDDIVGSIIGAFGAEK